MEMVYELVLAGHEDDKLVETDEPLDVGDAVAIDDEIWLVMREDRARTLGRARFECRRALRLRNQAEALLAYAKELELSVTKARAARVP